MTLVWRMLAPFQALFLTLTRVEEVRSAVRGINQMMALPSEGLINEGRPRAARGRRFAGRITGSYDLLITQRLIAQPEFEMNFYSKNDPSRGIGSGLSDLDTGIRIRYELSRKFAPYVGFAYTQTFGETATFTRNDGGIVHDPRFIFGVRVWY